ncbi:DUF3301 domain-containing protein [uncultured Psychromonas sp.]|uniref:DUF3301 domain-containing protein n=1 Tax=uncultured Psychromonas sp. TaxID=173974 RepID=UPI00260B41C4|nr:DUF3301 domain-containing protein [uncultured Psychromonas sp.]
MIWDLLFILVMVLVGTTIWKLRQQSELAKKMIEQHCKKLELQLLSFARSRFNYKLGSDFLQASFVFEFSSDGDNNYQGTLTLNGLVKPRFQLPAYRLVDDETPFF